MQREKVKRNPTESTSVRTKGSSLERKLHPPAPQAVQTSLRMWSSGKRSQMEGRMWGGTRDKHRLPGSTPGTGSSAALPSNDCMQNSQCSWVWKTAELKWAGRQPWLQHNSQHTRWTIYFSLKIQETFNNSLCINAKLLNVLFHVSVSIYCIWCKYGLNHDTRRSFFICAVQVRGHDL